VVWQDLEYKRYQKYFVLCYCLWESLAILHKYYRRFLWLIPLFKFLSPIILRFLCSISPLFPRWFVFFLFKPNFLTLLTADGDNTLRAFQCFVNSPISSSSCLPYTYFCLTDSLVMMVLLLERRNLPDEDDSIISLITALVVECWSIVYTKFHHNPTQ